MSENKHSPEPWRWNPVRGPGEGPAEITDARGLVIAQANGESFNMADLGHVFACVKACEGHDPATVRELLDEIGKQLAAANAATEPCNPP